MTFRKTLQRYWPETLLVLAVAFPWLSLLALGGVWLWQNGHTWAWAIAAAALGTADMGAVLAGAATDHAEPGARARSPSIWATPPSPRPTGARVEREIWPHVVGARKRDSAVSASPKSNLSSPAPARPSMTVARCFHPEAARR